MINLEVEILQLFDAKHDLRSYNMHNGDGRFNGTVNKGVKKSEEHRKKLSDSIKGEKHPYYGKTSPRGIKVIDTETNIIYDSISMCKKSTNYKKLQEKLGLIADGEEVICARPTLNRIQTWLRETHGIIIECIYKQFVCEQDNGFYCIIKTKDDFSRYATAGIACWFIAQVTVNIGSVTSLIPVIGVTLPFISYGGSSLLANLLAVGYVLGVARRTPEIAEGIKLSRMRKLGR